MKTGAASVGAYSAPLPPVNYATSMLPDKPTVGAEPARTAGVAFVGGLRQNTWALAAQTNTSTTQDAWQPYEQRKGKIHPTPEPAVYGAAMAILCLTLLWLRRKKRNH